MSRRLSPFGSWLQRLITRLDVTPDAALEVLNNAAPVYNVEPLDLLDRSGWRAFRAAVAVAAGAQVSQVQLFNPATSATDIILKSYDGRLGVANAWLVGWTDALIAGTVGATLTFGTRDSREAGTLAGAAALGVAQIVANNSIVLGTVGDFDLVQNPASIVYLGVPRGSGELIIRPGFGVLWHGNVAGALDVRFDWEEWPRRVQ